MNNAYNDNKTSTAYQAFLDSKNGQIFKQITGQAILQRLPQAPAVILDAGCGSGWLSGKIAKTGHTVSACDDSEELLKKAKNDFPNIDFKQANLEKPLTFAQNQFDAVVLNMVLHDLEDQPKAINNLKTVLKPNGKIIATIVNPYYGYPVAVWKRGFSGFLLRKKPKIKLAKAYNRLAEAGSDKSYLWNEVLKSRFYPLSEHLNNFIKANFVLNYYEDIKTQKDASGFNLNYQLFRVPIILLLEFKKVD